MAGPGGKRLLLGNHPFKQSTRDKQMHCCLNGVRCSCEELVPPVCVTSTLPDVTFSSAVLIGRLCAENVHVSLLQRFNNFFRYRVNTEMQLEKVIFFLKLGTFHRKHVPVDCNSFSKIANPRFIWLGKFGFAHSLIFTLDWFPFRQTLSVMCGRFLESPCRSWTWEEVRKAGLGKGDMEQQCGCKWPLPILREMESWGALAEWS